jgi:hypothetical protein
MSRIFLLSLTAMLVACGSSKHAASTTTSSTTTAAALGPFRQASVVRCLKAERVGFIDVRGRARLNPLIRKFPSVTGGIDILDATAKPPPGVSFGPAIDGGHLVFERTAAEAERDVARVYVAVHSVNPLNPPAPASIQPSLESTRGNVIILWDRRRHPALSVRLVTNCMPG